MSEFEAIEISDDDDDDLDSVLKVKAKSNVDYETRAVSNRAVCRPALDVNAQSPNSIDDIFPDFNWHILERPPIAVDSSSQLDDHPRSVNFSDSHRNNNQSSQALPLQLNDICQKSGVNTRTPDCKSSTPKLALTSDKSTSELVSKASQNFCKSNTKTAPTNIIGINQNSTSVESRELSVSVKPTHVVPHYPSTSAERRTECSTIGSSEFKSFMTLAEQWLRGRMDTVVQDALASAKRTIDEDATRTHAQSCQTVSLRKQVAELEDQLADQKRKLNAENVTLRRRAEAAEKALCALKDLPKRSVSTQTFDSTRSFGTQTLPDRITSQQSLGVQTEASTPKTQCASNTAKAAHAAHAARHARSEEHNGKSIAPVRTSTGKRRRLNSNSKSSQSSSSSSSSDGSSDSEYSILYGVDGEASTADLVTTVPVQQQTIETTKNVSFSSSDCDSTLRTPKKLRTDSEVNFRANQNSAHSGTSSHGRRPDTSSPSSSNTSISKTSKTSEVFRMEKLVYGVFLKYNGPRHPQYGISSPLPAPTFTSLDFDSVKKKLNFEFEYDERMLRGGKVAKFVVSFADSVRRRWFDTTMSAVGGSYGPHASGSREQLGLRMTKAFSGSYDVAQRLSEGNGEVLFYLFVQARDKDAQFSRLSMPIGARIYQRC